MIFKRRPRVSGEDSPAVPEPVSPVPGVAEDIADVPGWVNEFRRWGVPAAAVLVLVLCAPGEQHLADLSGWSYRMSWGLSGLFTLYAGLAAVISTQLPKKARGKTSSVWGAFISLGLAMAAQPIAHLFVTGYLTATPRPPLWLVGTVSSVPPLILGHLLHFAAMGASQRPAVPVRDKDMRQGQTATVTRLRPRPVPPVSLPGTTAVSPAVSRKAVTAAVPVSPKVSLQKGQTPGQAVPAVSPKGQAPVSPVRPGVPSMGTRALSLLRDGTPEDIVRDKLRAEYVSPDGVPPKTNSINKAVTRAKDKLSRP